MNATVVIGCLLLLALLAAAIIVHLFRELRIANDRLYGAWQTGAIIPPRSEPAPAPKQDPLPAPLQAYVDDWEEEDARARAEGEIRDMLAGGMSEQLVIKTLERRHGE